MRFGTSSVVRRTNRTEERDRAGEPSLVSGRKPELQWISCEREVIARRLVRKGFSCFSTVRFLVGRRNPNPIGLCTNMSLPSCLLTLLIRYKWFFLKLVVDLIDFSVLFGFVLQTMMMMKCTVCKVMFKGDERVLSSSSSSAGQIQHHHLSLIPHVKSNNSGGLSTETEVVGHFTTISFCVLPFLMSLRLNYRIHVSLLAFLIWRKKLCSWMKFSGVSTTRQLMIGTVCSVMMRNRGILCLCRRIATITDLKCHLLVFSLVIAMMTVILIPYLQELQQ